MELRHLRYFLAIAEHSHFRIAAEELLVSQPTLSQQMKDLEKELGCPLFERVGRGVRLTQAGSLFSDYARRAMNVLDEGQVAITEFDDLLRGSLRIGVVQTVGTYLIPTIAAEFSRLHPGVAVRISEVSASEIEAGVKEGSFDFGISFQPGVNRELESERLFDEQFVLVVGSKHPLACRRRVSIKDLSGVPLCLLPREFCTRGMIDAAFAESETPMTVPLELTAVEGCLSVVESGGPATILPQLAVTKRKIKTVRLVRPVIKREVCLITAQGRNSIRATEAYKE